MLRRAHEFCAKISRGMWLATLVQNQATLVQTQAAFVVQVAETNRQNAETNRQLAETNRKLAELERVTAERFARILALLLENTRLLQALPDAICEKIGFKPPA